MIYNFFLTPEDIATYGLSEDDLLDAGFTLDQNTGNWFIQEAVDNNPVNGLPDVLDALITGSDFVDEFSVDQGGV